MNNTATRVNDVTSLIMIEALNRTLMYLWNVFASVSCFSSKQDLSALPLQFLFSHLPPERILLNGAWAC